MIYLAVVAAEVAKRQTQGSQGTWVGLQTSKYGVLYVHRLLYSSAEKLTPYEHL